MRTSRYVSYLATLHYARADNPNVSICTLRMSSGEIKKRQEIGRGLRLSVNKDGERMDAEVLGTHSVHT